MRSGTLPVGRGDTPDRADRNLICLEAVEPARTHPKTSELSGEMWTRELRWPTTEVPQISCSILEVMAGPGAEDPDLAPPRRDFLARRGAPRGPLRGPFRETGRGMAPQDAGAAVRLAGPGRMPREWVSASPSITAGSRGCPGRAARASCRTAVRTRRRRTSGTGTH